MEEIIVRLSGVLQFDVLKYRLEEMNTMWRSAWISFHMSTSAGLKGTDIDLDKVIGTSDMKKIKDLKDRPLLLFVNSWSIRMTLDRNEGLVLSEFGRS